MTSERIPEAWIGEEVIVHTHDHREFVATLKEVRDFGFVYELDAGDPLIFASWSVALWMRLPGDEEELEEVRGWQP